MKQPLLSVSDLQVLMGDKTVVDKISFVIGFQEVVALVGANGSGKSSLAMALLGDARYQILEPSRLVFEGKDLLKLTADERAKAGLFVGWQNPVSIPGVTIFSLCKACYEASGRTLPPLVEFKKSLEKLAIKVGLPSEYIGRSVGEGFSGGEKKRLELLQLLLLAPKLAVLDEVDSGLDASGVKILMKIVEEMKQTETSFVIITHNPKMLADLAIDKTWEMKNGRLQPGV